MRRNRAGISSKPRQGFEPQIVVGQIYEDKWCTPYLRGEFSLPPGNYVLEIDVWNALSNDFEGNEIAVRSGFKLLHTTGPLVAGERRLIEVPLAVSVYNEAMSISVRSRIEWQPPPPDKRRVGFTLSRWLC